MVSAADYGEVLSPEPAHSAPQLSLVEDSLCRRLLPAPSGCLVGKELLPGAAPRPPARVLPWVPGGLSHVLLLRPDVPD